MENGFTFGNYRLIRQLGRGGMAEVFLAVQSGPHNFQRLVAIKSILPHLAENEQFVELFMEEARLSAMLSHPNLAHIYDFGIAAGTHYTAMEYIDGVDLRLVLRQQKSDPLPFEHAARIIADVCGALHYAHALCDSDGAHLNLVHRDISPHNILVSFNGGVKIVDFGLAKAAHHLNRTRPGLVRGKFTYMSPEQVTGQPLDGRSDLFTAGIVLYELCTNGTLLPRDDAMEAMRIIRSARFPRPLRDGQPIPPPLEQVLERCLARDREQRYATAAEMQLDLEAYLRSAELMSNAVVLGDYFQRHFQIYRQPEDAEVTRIQQLSEIQPWSQDRGGTAPARKSRGSFADSELAGDFPSLPAQNLEPPRGQGSTSSPMLPDSALEPLPDSALEPLPDSALEPLPDSALEPLPDDPAPQSSNGVAPSPLLQAMAVPYVPAFADAPAPNAPLSQEQPFSNEASTMGNGKRQRDRQSAPEHKAQSAGEDQYLVSLMAGASGSHSSASGSLSPRHWPPPAPVPQSEEQVLVTRPGRRGRRSRGGTPQRLALLALISGVLSIAALLGYFISAVPEPESGADPGTIVATPDALPPAPDLTAAPQQAAAKSGLPLDQGPQRPDAPAKVLPRAAPAVAPAARATATPSSRRRDKKKRTPRRRRQRRESPIRVEELPLD